MGRQRRPDFGSLCGVGMEACPAVLFGRFLWSPKAFLEAGLLFWECRFLRRIRCRCAHIDTAGHRATLPWRLRGVKTIYDCLIFREVTRQVKRVRLGPGPGVSAGIAACYTAGCGAIKFAFVSAATSVTPVAGPSVRPSISNGWPGPQPATRQSSSATTISDMTVLIIVPFKDIQHSSLFSVVG